MEQKQQKDQGQVKKIPLEQIADEIVQEMVENLRRLTKEDRSKMAQPFFSNF